MVSAAVVEVTFSSVSRNVLFTSCVLLFDFVVPVFFGHWAMRGLVQYKNVIGLDSGCVYGGSLSAYVLPDERWLSVPAREQYCKPK